MIKLFPRSDNSVGAKKRGWYGHVDGGGTYARVLIAEKGSGRSVYERKFTCADYGSIDEIVFKAFEEAGGIPDKMVFALAGPIDLEKQRVQFTNRPGWPDFSLRKMESATGVEGLLVNDMQLIAADAAWTDQSYLTEIKPGHVWPEGRLLILTWSTGVNSAIAEFDRTVALETGWGTTVAALTEDENSYIDFVAKKLKTPYPTVEQLIGGAHGLNFAPEWLESLGERPDPKTESKINDLRSQGRGLGAAITSGVDFDPFCQRILRVLGGIYGTHLRDLLATFAPTGGLHLVGSVNIAIAGKLTDPKVSPMIERIDDSRLPLYEIASKVSIVVNRDESLLSRGARVLAR
jgi:glucokinase